MILLDTHAMLWWADGDRRLSTRAAREIARTEVVHVSPVSFWELSMLVRLERISLDRDPHLWVRDLLATERVRVAELTPTAATSAGLIPDPFPGDPADRMLYAQARELAAPLVTKDGPIRAYAREARDLRTIW